jgi:4-diphosphocytidyl-2C-methyl-D-erythritol kinase
MFYVLGADCSFTTKLEDRNVVGIGSDVTLSCCLDKEHNVQWYKGQSEISSNNRFKFKDEQLKHQLTIADIQETDSGVYSCECGTTKTTCKLNVKGCIIY